MQNMGESAIRRKQLTAQQQMEMQRLALESQMRDIEQSRYNMAQARYEKMTELEQERGNIDQSRMDAMEKKYGLEDTLKKLDGFRQDLTQGLQGLAMDNSLTPEEKSAYFKNSVDSIGDDNMKKQLLVNPQFNAIYSGKANWDSIAQQVQASQAGGGARPGAIQQQIQAWRDAQAKANDSGDPDDQAFADKLAANLPASLKTTPPAVAPKPTEIRNTLYNDEGKPTNSVTSFQLPGTPASPQTGMGALKPTGIPTIHTQDDYDSLPPGTPYYDSFGKLATKSGQKPIPTGGGLPVPTNASPQLQQ